MSSKENKPSEPVEKAEPEEVHTMVWVRRSGNKITLTKTKQMVDYAESQGWKPEGAARK